MGTIDLVNLGKGYGDVIAVDQVNLHIEDGEFITILGPSGSGKTTLLTMIAGFENPTEGTVIINGKDVVGLPPNKRNIGLVFQNYALFPHMSVHENVAFPLSVRHYSKKEITNRVKEVLQILQLERYENRRIHQLSGGQQQRVALARAIAFNPSILLLDEPMAALDRKLRQIVQIELRQLQQTLGITTIAVTHDQEEALTMSDRILILHNGNVEQFGTPAELYKRPVNRFVAEFLGSANLIEGTAKVSNGKMLVDLVEGIQVCCSNSEPSGASCGHLMIRPQNIRLMSPDVRGTLPCFLGRIKSAAYLGSTMRYQIETAKGNKIIVNDANYFEPEENVALTLDPEESWFIADENKGGEELRKTGALVENKLTNLN